MRCRAQAGGIRDHQRLSKAASAFVERLGDELQREADESRRLALEVRSERDATDRHQTESRLLGIKVRNLKKGVARTVHAVVKEYHSLEAREERTGAELARARTEIREAEVTIASISRARIA